MSVVETAVVMIVWADGLVTLKTDTGEFTVSFPLPNLKVGDRVTIGVEKLDD